MMESSEKTCPECGSPIRGRVDKKYCSDECRSSYNNAKNRVTYLMLRRINAVLKKNRDLLLKFNPNGKAIIARSKLQSAGFNFNYHTNSYTTKSGKTYFFCYDQGYLELEKEQISLVHKQDYIE
jgi:predicted nucleic acid-binding Zn ribbon protein/YHS domain-containing protein